MGLRRKCNRSAEFGFRVVEKIALTQQIANSTQGSSLLLFLTIPRLYVEERSLFASELANNVEVSSCIAVVSKS